MADLKSPTNGTVDDTGYSSHVPLIGLYIAAASSLCMFLMLWDIIASFRSRSRWLPCKSFTLNSVTLALFSIAAKLPVDLTTPMPSPRDQLSKLSGTTFICISMFFLMPSLGVRPASESFTNMVALTIFVVTISANICMQLATGVIALFRTEHIIVLCSLLVILLMMWQSYWQITDTKKFCSEKNKEIFTNEEGSGFHRLRRSYEFWYSTNPQFVASLSGLINVASSMICTLCCGTLTQAAFRSVIRKELELCSGSSDYEWSMPLILIAQVFTVIIGSSAFLFRFLTMFKYITAEDIFPVTVESSAVLFRCLAMFKYITGEDIFWEDQYEEEYEEVDDVIAKNTILGITSRLDKYGRSVRYAFLSTMRGLETLMAFLPFVIFTICSKLMGDEGDSAFQEWVDRKSEEELEIWVSQNKSEPSSHLSQLLISPNYPQHQFDSMKVIDSSLPDQEDVYISSLSIILLVRIVQVSLRENHSTSLIQAFNEAKEFFYYTEKNITPKSFKNDNRLLFAKSVWVGQELSCLLPEIFNTTINPPAQSDLALALSIITQLKTTFRFYYDPVWVELEIIVDFINRKAYSTIQVLTTSVEQLFINMVQVMLVQLPNAIFKSLSNSTDEEYQESVKLALKMTCKVESIAEHVQWSFPLGLNFTRLVDIEATPQVDEISQV